MAGHQRVPGSRSLLFDRFAGRPDATENESEALSRPDAWRAPDGSVLRRSIRRELSDLLNSRAPLPVWQLDQRIRTTIDYGIPDLSAFPSGSPTAMDQLARQVRDAIIAYEPRLQDPVVEIACAPHPLDSLLVRVTGTLEKGTMRAMPVAFELLAGAVTQGEDVS